MSAVIIPIRAQLVPVEPDFEAIRADWANNFKHRELSINERAFLAVCQHLYRSHAGCNSPFEEFFRSLVVQCQFSGPLTPEEVDELTGEFREHFTHFVSDVRTFIGLYGTKALDR